MYIPEDESSPCLNTTVFGGTSNSSLAAKSSCDSSSSRQAKNLVDAKKFGVAASPLPCWLWSFRDGPLVLVLVPSSPPTSLPWSKESRRDPAQEDDAALLLERSPP